MPFTLVVIAFLCASLLVAWLRGGRLAQPIPGLAFPIVGALILVPLGLLFPGTLLARAGNIIGFLLLLPFWWLNRRSLGVAVLLTGIVLNMAVILLNGGMMPVDAAQAAAVGNPMGSRPQPRHQPLTEETLLPLLGDVIPVAPLGKVVSIGDLVAGIGVFLSIQDLMGRPLWRWPRGQREIPSR